MKDISTRNHILQLVDAFYAKVLKDDLISHFFTTVANLDFGQHLPIMYNFWEAVLLGGTAYKGNPMLKHIALNKKQALEEKHFNRWIKLWEETIDEQFTGQIAQQAKQRARSIKAIMEFKIKTI